MNLKQSVRVVTKIRDIYLIFGGEGSPGGLEKRVICPGPPAKGGPHMSKKNRLYMDTSFIN